jgi:hypothetical protein
MSEQTRGVSGRAQSSGSSETAHRMKLYSVAAVAAGVSALALAQPAEGEVIVTRKMIPIPRSDYFVPPPHPVYISLNNSGHVDFSFYLYSFAYHDQAWDLTVRPLGAGGGVQCDPKNVDYASALVRGAKIGPSARFSSGAQIEGEVRRFSNSRSSGSSWRTWGDWGKTSNKYLGVKFRIAGQTHYGWVRLSVSSGITGIEATIYAYAYETEPNKPITAGALTKPDEPVRVIAPNGPSLGALAAGAESLPKWRH